MITESDVRELFSHLEHGEGDAFFARVADDVDWTVMGTHPLAGRYRSKAAFREATFARLGKLLPGGTQLQVVHVHLAGHTAIVELRSNATAKNGRRFNNQYCWVTRFEGNTIVEVRAYLDSALVAKMIGENE